MRIEVTQTFRDILDRTFHNPGEIIEVGSERGANIISLGVGKEVAEPEAKPKETPAVQTKAETAGKEKPKAKKENAEKGKEKG